MTLIHGFISTVAILFTLLFRPFSIIPLKCDLCTGGDDAEDIDDDDNNDDDNDDDDNNDEDDNDEDNNVAGDKAADDDDDIDNDFGD